MKEKTARKLRLAYVLGSLRSILEVQGVVGDIAIFVMPPEALANLIEEDDEDNDLYRLGTVTPEEIVSLLKMIYAEDYKELRAEGIALRKKDPEKGKCCHCEECKGKRVLRELTKKHEALASSYIL